MEYNKKIIDIRVVIIYNKLRHVKRENIMEKRDLNISFGKSGAGNLTPRLTLPKKWIDKMNITPDERQVEVEFIEETGEIIIRKK